MSEEDIEKELLKKEALLEDYKERLQKLEDLVAELRVSEKVREKELTNGKIDSGRKQELEEKRDKAERRSKASLGDNEGEEESNPTLARLLQAGYRRGLWDL